MQLTIQSSKGPYEVKFIENLAHIIESVLTNKKKSACIIDENIIKYYSDFYYALSQSMPLLSFTATEQNKDLTGLSPVLEFMQKQGLNKKSDLWVIGGGITQDVSSLAAQLYYRGISYRLIPTTLLSMADSCIGSKSSLNFNGYKNQLGGFSPPSQVYICSQFLHTLTDQDIYSGLGEIFKLFIIDNTLGNFDVNKAMSKNGMNEQAIKEYVFKSLGIKKRFVDQDEFDLGVRRVLNYGHTFGHALELLTDYRIPHGLAVLLGIDIANYFSLKLGVLSKNSYLNIHQKIKEFYPWKRFNIKIIIDDLLNAVKQDKKSEDNLINMILLSDQKGAYIHQLAFNEVFRNDLANYFHQSDILYTISFPTSRLCVMPACS